MWDSCASPKMAPIKMKNFTLFLDEHKTHAHKVDDGLSHLGEVKGLCVVEGLQAGEGPLSRLD